MKSNFATMLTWFDLNDPGNFKFRKCHVCADVDESYTIVQRLVHLSGKQKVPISNPGGVAWHFPTCLPQCIFGSAKARHVVSNPFKIGNFKAKSMLISTNIACPYHSSWLGWKRWMKNHWMYDSGRFHRPMPEHLWYSDDFVLPRTTPIGYL